MEKNKEIIPKDTRYVPLVQQKWCCVPTCIQMVMLRCNIPLVSAELMGYHLGLIVPKEGLKYFWNARTGAKPPAGYGTQANKKEYGPNAVFRRLKIPLRMSWSLIDKFSDVSQFEKYLEKIEMKNSDVLVCFDWGTLFGGSHHGHVCVLDRVYLDKSEVRIIDPGCDEPKWKNVKIKKLFEAMKFHGKNKSGGFWELNKK